MRGSQDNEQCQILPCKDYLCIFQSATPIAFLRIYQIMCCCLVDCVGRFPRAKQALFIGLLDAVIWCALGYFTISLWYHTREHFSLNENVYYAFHDAITAARLIEEDKEFRWHAMICETTVMGLMILLDMLLVSSAWWRKAWIPPVWCVGMLICGGVRIGFLVWFWEAQKFLLGDKFYWILTISWINMMIDYFKELMEENNPKIELHLPYLRAVGSDHVADLNIPEMRDDPKDELRPQFILGYTNNLNLNLHMNKWQGVDYFGKIQHFVNDKSYFHV